MIIVFIYLVYLLIIFAPVDRCFFYLYNQDRSIKSDQFIRRNENEIFY